MARWIAKLALLSVSLLLVLGVAEFVLRTTVYRYSGGYDVSPGPNSEYVMERYEFKTPIHTNSLNMRWDEIAPRAPGEYRVVCMGDSFTFGLGVQFEEVYAKQLEKRLRERSRATSVVGVGVGGNVIDQMYFYRQHEALFDPDLIVVEIYVGNDFYDSTRASPAHPDLPAEAHGAARAAPPDPDAPTGFAALKARLRESRVLDLLWTNLVRVPPIGRFALSHGLRYENRSILLRQYPPFEQALVDTELAGLQGLIDYARARGSRVIAIIVPDTLQLFESGNLDPALYDPSRPDRLLREFFARENVTAVDFLELYATLPPEQVRSFYYAKDTHWTAAGHAFAAQVLAERIGRELPPPEARRN